MSRVKVAFWLFRTKRKDGTYHPRWRFRYIGPDGTPKKATGFTDRGETRRLATQLALEADEIRRGVRKAPQAAETESLRPIEEHVKAYLAWGRTQGGRGGRPWAAYYGAQQETRLEWWTNALKLSSLRDITLSDAEKALQGEVKRGLAGKTVSDKAMTLHGFVTWCLKRKLLSADPLDGLSQFDTSVTAQNFRRPFTLDEIGKLLAVTPEPQNLIYRLALVTGFRAGELASLQVGSLDLENRILLLAAAFAKDRKEASCALPADLAQALADSAQGRAAEEKLFPTWKQREASREIGRFMKAAGISRKNFHGKADFHSLRTTHVNLGIELGFDVKTAQTLARHKTPT